MSQNSNKMGLSAMFPGYKGMRMSTDQLDSPFIELLLQIEAEYQSSKRVLDPKVTEWQRRLKVYNNQRRDKDAVGDPLLFTNMQTILASLYDDQLMVEFTGKNEGDEDVAGNLNSLAEYDYDVMEKYKFDYYWNWNTCFFGRSVIYFTNFDHDRDHTPMPDLQNMMLFYRDPKAQSINGDILGRNASRFFGRIIEMTKPMMEDHPEFYDLDLIKLSNTKNTDAQTNRQAYQDAAGLNQNMRFEEKDFRDNAMYELLEWCTHWKDPRDGKVKKILVTLANDRKKVVRYHEFVEADKKPATTWPVLDRPMYPTSHDWDGTSVPDLVEDKQRMRAVLQNLGIKSLKASLYPMYLYDKKRIKNRADLNFDFNKFIPVEPGGNIAETIHPMQKSLPNETLHAFILGTLSQSANQATATPEMQQGRINEKNRKATEIAIVDRNIGTRYSLTAKVFGWSEKAFWQQWYTLYKMHFKDNIHEKILRLDGAFGAKFRPLQRKNIITKVDPDIRIISRVVSDAKKNQERQLFAQYFSLVAQAPGANVRYGLKKMGKFINLERDEIDRLLPPTIDERIAEEENDQLNQDIKVIPKANDNHEQHLEVHAKAADTDAAFAHIQAHKFALETMRNNPQLAKEVQGSQPQQQQPQQNNLAQLLNGAGGGESGQQ